MIERLVRRHGTRGQFRFATEAKAKLPARPDYLAAKSHRGLHVLGPNEHALVLPIRVLRSAYGEAVHIDRQARGEPVMEVRIGLVRRFLPAVLDALRRRGANASEEYLGVHHCVLRFEARLPGLLGLPLEIAERTAGTACQEILLSRYERPGSDRGRGAP